ncbi:hypothetical protein [Lentzea sp. NPDC051838]|uniref:hypothetical protein n=1 Tax=Lentzea sp. NPDC051838 TaxID=3154849 RepID=UPI003430BB1C
MLTRALTGVLAGVLGAVAIVATTPLVAMVLTRGPFVAYGIWPIVAVVFGALGGTALLHVMLLKLLGQQRAWSVVAPGIVLAVLQVVTGGDIGFIRLAVVLAAAFAVAGLVTGPWREVLAR